jgi:hypothetical protein
VASNEQQLVAGIWQRFFTDDIISLNGEADAIPPQDISLGGGPSDKLINVQ